jgi:hypothetical protein
MFLPLKMQNVERILWKFTLSSKRRILSKTLRLLTSILLCQHLHVSLPVCMTGFFSNKWVFLPIENDGRQGVLLWQANSILKRKQCARHSCFPLWLYLSRRYMCLFHSAIHRPVYCKVNDSPIWKCGQVESTLLKVKLSSQRGAFSNRLNF